MNTDTSHRADHRSTSRTRPLVGPESIVGRHQLISFFVLSYLLAWGPVPFGTFVAFSPLIAAIIVIALSDPRNGFRDLVSRMLRWRVGWQWLRPDTSPVEVVPWPLILAPRPIRSGTLPPSDGRCASSSHESLLWQQALPPVLVSFSACGTLSQRVPRAPSASPSHCWSPPWWRSSAEA
jgi:hypothetical protein